MARWSTAIQLVGAGGEPVDFARTLLSHGVADLPPNEIAADGTLLRTALTAGGGAWLVDLTSDGVGRARLGVEALRDPALPDQEVADRLLQIAGVGPYAMAHMMMLLGRYQRLILDSWTRPKYRRVSGRQRITDKGMERAFRRYRQFAGLAFWLMLTEDWLPANP